MTDPITVKVLVFAASRRDDSLNGRLATRAAQVLEDRGADVDLARMEEFDAPSYDHDTQDTVGFPPAARAFRERLEANDAFVITSPEYNFSMPGIVKNAIDWVSRYRPQPFNGRHGLLMSASPSMVGGNRGLWALRVPLEHLGARIFPDMLSLAQAHRAFDDQGRITDEKLRSRFEGTIGAFLELVEADKHYPCAKKAWIEFLGERPDPVTDRKE